MLALWTTSQIVRVSTSLTLFTLYTTQVSVTDADAEAPIPDLQGTHMGAKLGEQDTTEQLVGALASVPG